MTITRAKPRPERGFTLLEMVVAIGVFAVIAAITYGSLNRFVAARDVINDRNKTLSALQITMSLLEYDFRYAANRPVRDGFGDEEPALVGGQDQPLGPGELVRLTVYRPDTHLSDIPALQRVAWRLEDGVLKRVTWSVLDRDQDSQEYPRDLLEQVDDVEFRFLTTDREQLRTHAEWLGGDGLPMGVEFLVTLKNGRQYRRVFELANGA